MNVISGQLPHLGVLRLAGADTLTFLQGQISNDTQALAQGRALLAAYSTPQGRVLSILHLLPHSSGVLGILPRELVAPTVERLRRYVLRAKVRIEDASGEMGVTGQFGALPPSARALHLPQAAESYTETDGVGIASVDPPRDPAPGAARYWVVGAASRLANFGLAGDPAAADRREQEWRLADIGAGMPQVYAASSELFVAQMLNLDLLGGISFTKGCFTGQEIIARTQHLGRIKRRLFRLRLPPGNWRIGGTVHLADGRSGRLTEIARSGEDYEALAVLPLEAAASGEDAAAPPFAQEAHGRGPGAATELPLPYSLAGPQSP